MGINNKYTTEERQTAIRIYQIQRTQAKLRKEWLDLDISLNTLKIQLNGKYTPRRNN